MKSGNDRLKLQLDEKVYDLQMAQKNIKKLTEMVEENTTSTETQQQERLQNIAGMSENWIFPRGCTVTRKTRYTNRNLNCGNLKNRNRTETEPKPKSLTPKTFKN